MPPIVGCQELSIESTVKSMEKCFGKVVGHPTAWRPGGTQRPRQLGLTILELLLVLAILGIVLGLGFFNARRALLGSQERAAVQTVRQSIWQGATAASSRGRPITLVRDGNSMRLVDGDNVIRSDDFPDGVTTNFSQGVLLEFSPPGKVTAESLAAFMESNPQIGGEGRTQRIEVSVIGEVRVVGGG